jgi:hypothetical protein
MVFSLDGKYKDKFNQKYHISERVEIQAIWTLSQRAASGKRSLREVEESKIA